MIHIGVISYLSSLAGYTLLAALLLTSWNGGRKGALLVLVAVMQALWAGFAAYAAYNRNPADIGYAVLESLRYVSWYLFLLQLIKPADDRSPQIRSYYKKWLAGIIMIGLLVPVFELSTGLLVNLEVVDSLISVRISLHVILAIIGLALIEQVYRNISDDMRWSIKYLILAAGLVFIYDLFVYSNAMLFKSLDENLWNARGFVEALAVPLIAISAARNKKWELEIYVSRDIMMHTTAILGGGLYLLLMSAIGLYLREAGGQWGGAIQVLFLCLSLILLASVLFSGQIQTKARVFVGKHFYRNKYDYRREWIRLTEQLVGNQGDADQLVAVIKGMAQIVDCQSAMLWLVDDYGGFRNSAVWNMPPRHESLNRDNALISYLQRTGYIINLEEVDRKQEEYKTLLLPDWIHELERVWLIVPLFHGGELLGFSVLAKPLAIREINWEDRDLLKVAGQQVASHLAIMLTSAKLAEAKQFETFNRLSAYMVHDLKNIVAELELVVKNSEKHKTVPAFIDDAFLTVDNAARNISRLLDQLRGKNILPGKRTRVDLQDMVREAVRQVSGREPEPVIKESRDGCMVTVEKDRLIIVLRHLIENAQQATSGQQGYVHIYQGIEDGEHYIRIVDNGCGMDEVFIRERLFKPFDTTKGNSGMGIGMYESREITWANGGELRVSSQPGQGTIISIILPAPGISEK